MASPVEDIYQTAEFIQPTYLSWIGAVLGTVMVGLSGLVPMLIIPLDAGQNLRSEQGSRTLRLLLSFAVGGLLGDVFLHLFPESYGALSVSGQNRHTGYLVMGLWILGMLCCTLSRSNLASFCGSLSSLNRRKTKMTQRKFIFLMKH